MIGFDWMLLVEEIGDIRFLFLDFVDEFWLFFVSFLDLERLVFKDVIIFWIKCSFVLFFFWLLNILLYDLKVFCKVFVGLELDCMGEGVLEDFMGFFIRDLEFLFFNLNVFMSFDINFLLDFFIVFGL